MHVSRRNIVSAVAAAAVAGIASYSMATSDSWKVGVAGSYTDPANWVNGNVPNDGALDVATVEGANSSVTLSSSVALLRLDLAQSSTGGAPVFTQTDGTLSAGSIRFGGAGGSRNPTYNLNGGQVDFSTFTWGNGSNARFNVSGGTANYSGSVLTIGVASGANGTISVSAGTFNHSGTGQIQLGTTSNGRGNITMSGGTFNTNSTQFRIGSQNGGTGNITLLGNSVLNANATNATTNDIYLGNNGGSGNLVIGDTAQFNAAEYLLVAGQFGNTAGNKGTISMSGGTLKASRIVLGGNNTASAIYGTFDLMNGATVETGQIRKGNSSTLASATANYFRSDGGTVKVVTNVNNASFFDSAFVTLSAGGLTFNTNGNDVGINNAIVGVGGINKTGLGTLSLTGGNLYTGTTTVSAGVLRLAASDVIADTAGINLVGTTLNADGATETVGTLSLSGGGAATIQFGTVDADPQTPTLHKLVFTGLGTLDGTLNVTNWEAGVDQFVFANEADANTVAAITTFINPSYTVGTEGAMVIAADGGFAVVAPEPAGLALFALGAMSLLSRRRRKM